MAFPLSQTEIEKEVLQLFVAGLSGSAKDFHSWVYMETFRKFKDHPEFEIKVIADYFDKLKAAEDIEPNPLDPREFTLSVKSPNAKKVSNAEKFIILGALKYNPIQYVRSRLENFLKKNSVDEEIIMDLCIATVEAVENSAKYGDGLNVDVTYNIDRNKIFTLEMLNKVKDFNLEDDILRGKFSSTATLMRGMMVMQKLYDTVDLDILDNRRQAYLKASRKIA